MKTIQKSILFGLFALMMVFSVSAKAQGNSQYPELKAQLTDFIAIAAQAQGTANQVETFATNGNTNQLSNRIAELSSEISSLQTIASQTLRNPITNRLDYTWLSGFVSSFNADMRIFASIYGADNNTIAFIAGRLRERISHHRGEAQEIRVALCCVMP